MPEYLPESELARIKGVILKTLDCIEHIMATTSQSGGADHANGQSAYLDRILGAKTPILTALNGVFDLLMKIRSAEHNSSQQSTMCTQEEHLSPSDIKLVETFLKKIRTHN